MRRSVSCTNLAAVTRDVLLLSSYNIVARQQPRLFLSVFFQREHGSVSIFIKMDCLGALDKADNLPVGDRFQHRGNTAEAGCGRF